MTDTRKEKMSENIFETGNILGLYVKLALPLVFSLTVTPVYTLADTFFVARTKNADLVAGVSLCAPLFTFLMALGNILAQGGSSLISRLMGQGNQESVERVSSFCFYATLCSGIAVGVVLLIFRVPMLQALETDSDTFSYASDYSYTSFQVFGTKRVKRQSKCGRMNDVTQTDYPERGGSHDIMIRKRERNWQVAELVFRDFFSEESKPTQQHFFELALSVLALDGFQSVKANFERFIFGPSPRNRKNASSFLKRLQALVFASLKAA